MVLRSCECLYDCLRLFYFTLPKFLENLILSWRINGRLGRPLIPDEFISTLVNLLSQLCQPLAKIRLAKLLDVIVRLNLFIRFRKVCHFGGEHFEKMLDCFTFLGNQAPIFSIEARLERKRLNV